MLARAMSWNIPFFMGLREKQQDKKKLWSKHLDTYIRQDLAFFVISFIVFQNLYHRQGTAIFPRCLDHTALAVLTVHIIIHVSRRRR